MNPAPARTVLAMAIAIAMLGAPAWSQDAVPEGAPAGAAEPAATIPVAPPAESARADAQKDRVSDPTQLEEIVVTATKRAETERSVPLSINAFKGSDLEKQGATGAEQILSKAPGVMLNKGVSPDNNYVSIRGVSSDSRNNINSRPTGIFLGDVSLTNPSTLSVLADVDPTDLSTVEILKGPQGTLFGGSALSGAIRYIPNAPQLGTFTTHLAVTGGAVESGDDPTYAYSAMVNVPIGDSLAIRAAGVHRKIAGYIDDTFSGEDDINHTKFDQVRPSVRWSPLDPLTIGVSWFYRKLDASSGGTLDDVDGRTISNRRVASPSHSKVKLPELRAAWDFESSQVVALASQLRITGSATSDLTPSLGLDATPISAYEPFVSDVKQPSYELRWVSTEPFLGFNYLLGAFYMRSRQQLDLHTTINNPLGTLAALLDPLVQSLAGQLGLPPASLRTISSDVFIHAKAKEKAAFLDISRELFDDVTLELGGRYYDQETLGRVDGGVSGVPYPETEEVRTPLSPVLVNQPEKGWNPKAALTWKPSDRFSIYTSAVKGFRFGGINSVAGLESQALDIPATFKSDHLWNYEVGVRTDWLDHRLTFDVTGFYIDWTNVQILQLKAGAFGYTDNVGGACSQGVEAMLRTRFDGGFLATLGAAYIDARTTQSFASESGTIDSGARLPATPYLTGNASISRGGELFGVHVLGTYGLSYQGPTHNTLQNDYPLPGYFLHNLALGLTLPGSFTPELNLSVTNLYDHHVPAFALVAPGGPQIVSIQPRTILLTLGFTY